MNLRTTLLALPLALVLAASFATAQPTSETPPGNTDTFGTHIYAMLKGSQEKKHGLVFYVGGQTIPGAVKEVGRGWVRVANQEYGNIVININRIDAVAAN